MDIDRILMHFKRGVLWVYKVSTEFKQYFSQNVACNIVIVRGVLLFVLLIKIIELD